MKTIENELRVNKFANWAGDEEKAYWDRELSIYYCEEWLKRNLLNAKYNVEVPTGRRELHVSITPSSTLWANMRFTLTMLYGNSLIVESAKTYICPELRGKGYSYKLQELKEILCKAHGVKHMIATVSSENKAEITVLRNSRWSWISVLYGKIDLWKKDIT